MQDQPPYEQPPAHYPPPPYQPPFFPPPPPPKKGLSGAAIAGIILAVAAVVGIFIVIPLAVGVYLGIKRAPGGAKAMPVSPSDEPLSISYTTPNRLLTAHYPADFAAKTLDEATLGISRKFTGGDESITLAAIHNPITDDPHELARILLRLVDKNVTQRGGTSTKTSEKETLCLGKYKGVETEGTLSLPGFTPYLSKMCFFVHADRGYEVGYNVTQSRASEEAPLLTRIIEATDFAP